MTLVEQLHAALDDGLADLVKSEQASLANRLGADLGEELPGSDKVITAADERQFAATALANFKKAHATMRDLVAEIFG